MPHEEAALHHPSVERCHMLERMPRKLHTALDYATNTCILGASNRMDDLKKTNGWSSVQKYRYFCSSTYMKTSERELCSQKEDGLPNAVLKEDTEGSKITYEIGDWYCHFDMSEGDDPDAQFYQNSSLNPLEDPTFNLKSCNLRVLSESIFALTTRYGNCGVRSRLVSKYLWEHPEGIHRIEGIKMNTFNHVLVVINRSGDLKNSDTWGNAWIIETWCDKGAIFPATEFKEKIKQIKYYAQEQIKQAKIIGFSAMENYPESDQDIGESIWEINPSQDHYPSYTKHMRVENYFTVINGYADDVIEILKNSEKYLNTEVDVKEYENKKEKKEEVPSILTVDKSDVPRGFDPGFFSTNIQTESSKKKERPIPSLQKTSGSFVMG